MAATTIVCLFCVSEIQPLSELLRGTILSLSLKLERSRVEISASLVLSFSFYTIRVSKKRISHFLIPIGYR